MKTLPPRRARILALVAFSLLTVHGSAAVPAEENLVVGHERSPSPNLSPASRGRGASRVADATISSTVGQARADLVRVDQAWARGTVPGQSATGAFMVLKAARDARLVGASSPVAKVVEIHEMKMSGEVMTMRAISGIDLPAGRAVALEPGGYHLMLLGLARPLGAGDGVPLRLRFKTPAGRFMTQQAVAVVRPLGEGAEMAHPDHSRHDHQGHSH